VIITKLQVAPVELDVSSQSSSSSSTQPNAWARHVECVESSRVESSQVEFEPIQCLCLALFVHLHFYIAENYFAIQLLCNYWNQR